MSLFIFSISSWFGLEGFPGGAVGKNKTTTTKNLPANADVRDVGSIPGSGKFLGVENGNLLWYSFLETQKVGRD